MTTPAALQYASAASAFISAGLWLWTARMKLPNRTTRLITNGVLAPSTPRDDAMKLQSLISAGAAATAGIAAALQGLATMLTPAG